MIGEETLIKHLNSVLNLVFEAYFSVQLENLLS